MGEGEEDEGRGAGVSGPRRAHEDKTSEEDRDWILELLGAPGARGAIRGILYRGRPRAGALRRR